MSSATDIECVPEGAASTARPSRGEYLWAALLFLAISLVHTWPLWSHFDNWGIMDWDQHFFYHAVPCETLLKYHQVPLWNPYYCGGAPLLANPQSRILSATFPLVLAFDVERGLKLEIWVNLAFGLLGTYVLARHLQLRRPAAFLVAGIFMLNTMYSLALASGMTHFLAGAYLPWAVWAYLRSYDRLPWAILSALFLALAYLAGGHYVVPLVILFMVCHGVCSLFTHGPVRVVKVLLLIWVLSAGLGAVKLFPSGQLMLEYPRKTADYSGYSLNGLVGMMLSRDQTLTRVEDLPRTLGFWKGVSYEMDENGLYVGVLPLALFAAGLVARGRRWWKLVLCLLIFLWLSFGNRIPLSLWEWLHHLPIYDSMRVATRFRIIWLLCLGLLAGVGLDLMFHLLRRWTGKALPAHLICGGLVAVVAADLVTVSHPVFAEAFPFDAQVLTDGLQRRPAFVQINRLPLYDRKGYFDNLDWFDTAPIEAIPVNCSYSALYPAFLTNRGSVWAYETIPIARNAVPQGSLRYRGEVFMDRMRGSAEIVSWSPNRIDVQVDAFDEDRLVVNQNFAPGWKVSGAASGAESSDQGLLSAAVTPHTKLVTFRYRPVSVIVGTLTSLVTLIGCLVFALRRYRAGKRAA